MPKSVVIDCFPSSAARYVADYHDRGRRCDPRHHHRRHRGRDRGGAAWRPPTSMTRGRCATASVAPSWPGELAGDMADGFDMNNSPSHLAERDDVERPLVMVSTSGTALMLGSSGCSVAARSSPASGTSRRPPGTWRNRRPRRHHRRRQPRRVSRRGPDVLRLDRGSTAWLPATLPRTRTDRRSSSAGAERPPAPAR